MDLRTSEDWQKICRIKVRDPDGWDRENLLFSWYKEEITREEFERRLSPSTCEHPFEVLIEKKSIWIDKEN